MNNLRIIGSALFVIGILLHYYLDHWATAAASGAMFIFGIYMMITGKKPLDRKEQE